jgi:hypothetical protein
MNLLTGVPAGPHTFLVQAADAVGNMSSLPVAFSVIVTPAVISAEVTHFRSQTGKSIAPAAAAILIADAQYLMTHCP